MANKRTPDGIVSYPHLISPTVNTLKKTAVHPGGTPEYSVILIWGPEVDLSEMVAEAERVLLERFHKRPPNGWSKGGYRTPFKSCDEKAAEKGEMPAGMMKGGRYVTFRTERRPMCFDQNVQPIMESEMIYGGCHGCVSYSAYAYDAGANKGVNFGLRNFQFTGDGEHLGSDGGNPEEDFKPASRTVLADSSGLL